LLETHPRSNVLPRRGPHHTTHRRGGGSCCLHSSNKRSSVGAIEGGSSLAVRRVSRVSNTGSRTQHNMVPVAVKESWTRRLASCLPLLLILIMINTAPLRQVQARVGSSRATGAEKHDGPIAAAGRRRPHGVARNASMDAAAGGVDLQSLPQLALTPYCKRGSCYYCSQCVGCCTCLAGAYCPGDDQQYPCNAGTYNPLTNQTSAAACQSCGPGKYSAVAGASACATCPINTYSQRGSGSLACVPCPWGTYTTQSGQSSASACLLNGTYTGS